MTDAETIERLTRSIEKLCATVEAIRDCMRELTASAHDHGGAIETLIAGQSAIVGMVAAIRDQYAAIFQGLSRRLDILEADALPPRELIHPLN
jgi:hypothetical protein